MPNGFHFRIDTNKGRLYAYVEEEDPQQAENWLKMVILHGSLCEVSIGKVILLKRSSGEGDQSIKITKDSGVFAGRKVWYALGRGIEYDLKMAEVKEQWEAKDA